MRDLSEDIPGYAFGSPSVPTSPVSLQDLARLKETVGFQSEDIQYLLMAGDVLAAQTKNIVEHWRVEIIGRIPHLARHSRSLDDKPLPVYLARSNRRFEQWIMDTCLRPYDQSWLNYQNEIALRHTKVAKNKADGVESSPFVPLRDVIGFVVVMNATIKPHLAAAGHSTEDVEKMHSAWCKSLQLQVALWAWPYADATLALEEW
jgi:hypothetical protein